MYFSMQSGLCLPLDYIEKDILTFFFFFGREGCRSVEEKKKCSVSPGESVLITDLQRNVIVSGKKRKRIFS